VAITHAADGTLTLFRNGVPWGKPWRPESGPSSLREEARTRVLIGCRHTGGGNAFFRGEIEDVRVYDRALSPNELLASFRAGASAAAIPVEQRLAALTPQERTRRTALQTGLDRIQSEWKSIEVAPQGYAANPSQPGPTHVLARGEFDKPREEVTPGTLSGIVGVPAELGLDSKSPEAERRRRFADWVASSSNPLTARVFVNRVWQWHFGQGLVPTASDFGLRGEPPTHPELLDWLTSEYIASGGSLKALHRLIMRSQTYQLASDDNTANLKQDPSNRWLWRFTRHPLDAESIRDAMLAVSGKLDRTVPGPHPFPPVEKWAFTIHRPFHESYDSDHRSVYLMLQRDRRHPFLSMFDAADPNQSIGQRMPTTTPTQTLYLMNSPFVIAVAEKWAAALGQKPDRVDQLYLHALGRQPTAQEKDQAESFAAEAKSFAPVVQAIFNLKEFLYVR
jgi:hypothetical protein